MAAAERHNVAGNAAYKAGSYQEAAEHYGEAIKADGSTAKYRTNRANALWKLGAVAPVLADAEAAVQLDVTWLKGHYYRGIALERLGRFEEAIQSLRTAVQLELSEQVAKALPRCYEARREQRAFCLGRLDLLTQLVRSRTAEQHKSLKKHTTANSSSSSDRSTLKAYDAVVAGDKLCAAAADVLRGDLTHAKQQFAAAAEQYKLAAELGCAVGMFNCAQLLRLGLAEELQADGTPAVAYQAAMRHLTSAMQQDLVIDIITQLPPELQQEQPAGNGSVGTRCQNLGVAESHVLAGDMQRDGLWGVNPASLQEALATYTKATNASQQPHPAALVAIGKVKQMQGDNRDAIEWYRKAVWQEYGPGDLGVATLLAQDAKSNWEGHPDWMAEEKTAVDKLAALDGALLAAKHGLPRAKALAATLEADEQQAAALLLQAVEEDGHPQCLLVAARGYGHGQYGLPKDEAKAQTLLLQAAVEEGWPDAMDLLASAYAGGFFGFTTDLAKAMPLFEHAGHLGVQPAMYKAAAAYLSGIGVQQGSLSKARHWAQRALEAAPDAKAKADAAKLLADIQSKQQQFSESAWAAMVQVHWGCMQDSVIGPTVAEVSSRRDGDLDKAGREQYKSFMMTVAQQAGGQTPAAAAAAASASAASSARADSSSKPQQKQQQKQPQYPSTASFVEAAAGVAASAEASSRGKAAIVGFFGDTAKFKLAGEKQRQQQARELQIAAVNLIKGCGDWELGIPAMAAGYILNASAMLHPNPNALKVLQEATLLYSKRHPDKADGQILHAFLTWSDKGHRWLVQKLRVEAKVEDPVLRGLLLLSRSMLQVNQGIEQWQGALADAEAGLLLLPEHPDLLYMRAWSINAVKYNPLAAEPVGLAKSMSREQLARRKQAAAETAAAYQRFLDAAPDVHRNKPAALYYLAYIPLNDNVGGASWDKVTNKSQALYDKARAAEAQLPEEWLPVGCAVRDKVPLYLAFRRAMADGLDPGMVAATTGNAHSSRSSRSRSGSMAAAAGRAQASGSSGSSRASASSSSSSSSAKNSDTPADVAPARSKSRGKSRCSGGSSSSKSCCAGCGVVGVKLRKCSGCEQVAYCNRECQTAHWKEHKKACSSRQ